MPRFDTCLSEINERYPLIAQVFDLAVEQGIPTYLVGGTVRDVLLGRDTHDLDFAAAGDGLALARHIADLLHGSYVALDRTRRVGRVLLRSQETRGSASHSGNVYLDVASLRGPNLEADLRDRDFTINAMAVERRADSTWHLLDPLDGYEDLRQRILRSASSSSFADDPVRTLRAVRMRNDLNCTIEPQTRAWLESAVPLLARVSAERIRDEWFKILDQPGASHALPELYDLGLLRIVAPPIERLRGFAQEGTGQGDALDHSFAVVRQLERIWAAFEESRAPPSLFWPEALSALAPQIRERYRSLICDERTFLSLLKCAAFLHNAGKAPAPEAVPAAAAQRRKHERRGAEIALHLARQWRLSNVEGGLLQTVVLAHACPARLAAKPALTRRAVYRYFRDTGECGVDAAIVSLADYLAAHEPDADSPGWRRHVETVTGLLDAYFTKKETWIDPPLLLSGKDLMEMLALPPGPRIGKLLSWLHEEQAAGEIHSREEAVARLQEWVEGNKTPGQEKVG
jgi:hypothetical protein